MDHKYSLVSFNVKEMPPHPTSTPPTAWTFSAFHVCLIVKAAEP